MMKTFWTLLIAVLTLTSADAQNRHKKRKNAEPFLVFSHGAGAEQIIAINGWAPDWKIFKRTGQVELSLFRVALQVTPWLQVFGTVQYNSFEYVVDVANYQSREDNLNTPTPIVLGIPVSEYERNKRQEVLLPTIGMELGTKVKGHFYLNAGIEGGKYKHQTDYFYEGAWGYNKDADGTFDQIEINTLSTPKEPSRTRKVNAYLLPEWRGERWRVGLSAGLQFKSFRGREFSAESIMADYSRWSGFPHGIYAVNNHVWGITTGLRIAYVVARY